MKIVLFLIISLLVTSCFQDDGGKLDDNEIVEIGIEVSFAFTLFSCEESCPNFTTLIRTNDSKEFVYDRNNLPDSIKSEFDWQNKKYLCTIKYLEEECICILGEEPQLGEEPEDVFRQKVEIIAIQEVD